MQLHVVWTVACIAYLGASAIKYAGIIDPALLKAHACREALSLALDLDLTHVIIVSDCQAVVTNINKGSGGLYAGIVREIQATANQFTVCSFIFEDYIEAHSFAKHTLGLSFGRHI